MPIPGLTQRLKETGTSSWRFLTLLFPVDRATEHEFGIRFGDQFDVVMTALGSNEAGVLGKAVEKVVAEGSVDGVQEAIASATKNRKRLPGYGLEGGATRDEAESAKATLKAAGATVEIRGGNELHGTTTRDGSTAHVNMAKLQQLGLKVFWIKTLRRAFEQQKKPAKKRAPAKN